MSTGVSTGTPSKVFFSYHGPDEQFVKRVRDYMTDQSPFEVYFFPESQRADSWSEQVTAGFNQSDAFVLFAGEHFGNTQQLEIRRAFVRHDGASIDPINFRPMKLLAVQLCDVIDWPGSENAEWIPTFRAVNAIKKLPTRTSDSPVHEGHAQVVAQEICLRLGGTWRPHLGIPHGYPFEYEKLIIEEYVKGGGQLDEKRVAEGCPRTWPQVMKRPADSHNLVPEELIGTFSSDERCVFVDVRAPLMGRSQGFTGGFTFAEARPRGRLYLPRPERLREKSPLNVGILVSGGIAPGINAVIAGIVERHRLYGERGWSNESGVEGARRTPQGYKPEIFGFLNGFRSVEAHGAPHAVRFGQPEWTRKIKEQANTGGSLLGTSRLDKLLGADDPTKRVECFQNMVRNLRFKLNIDVLYVIGGDGSMRAAHALQKIAHEEKYPLTVVGIPKTMDNDILWVWQSFGFLSAVEKAREFIMQLHTEVESNPRVCVMQLFGSDSGFVVSHAAVASGVADLALIPEIPFSMQEVSAYIRQKLNAIRRDQLNDDNPNNAGKNPHALILMAETAIPVDVQDYIANDEKLPHAEKILRLEPEELVEIDRYMKSGMGSMRKRHVRGQTPDALRTGGLKIVSRVLQDAIKKMNIDGPYWDDFKVFTNEPRHLLRSLEPSSSDVVFGRRLGCLAVDNAMAGYTDFMVSQWLTEFVLVPLELVVLGRKRVPRDGIFWKSVLDSTGQPSSLEGASHSRSGAVITP